MFLGTKLSASLRSADKCLLNGDCTVFLKKKGGLFIRVKTSEAIVKVPVIPCNLGPDRPTQSKSRPPPVPLNVGLAAMRHCHVPHPTPPKS